VDLLFHALSMLCGLGAATFATVAAACRLEARRQKAEARRFSSVFRLLASLFVLGGALAAGLGAAVVSIGPERLPDPVWTAGLVALVAILQLIRPGLYILTAACGGALAGLWSMLLRSQALPPAPALILATALPLVAVCLAARRPNFAPVALREEALLLMAALGVAVAIAPDIAAGWRSAVALNLADEGPVNQIVPTWVVILSGASLALGGLYSWWTHR
jgi:hypothetical protein